jgi:hypothetical protein
MVFLDYSKGFLCVLKFFTSDTLKYLRSICYKGIVVSSDLSVVVFAKFVAGVNSMWSVISMKL